MAQWDITVPAATNWTPSGSVPVDVVTGLTPPSDFDGATINSVVIVNGTGAVSTNNGPTDDSAVMHWWVTNTADTSTYGDNSPSVAICDASVGANASGSDITGNGASISPAPTSAVAADWNKVRRNGTYTADMKDDGETFDNSAFTIRVDYTPAAIELTTVDCDSTGAIDNATATQEQHLVVDTLIPNPEARGPTVQVSGFDVPNGWGVYQSARLTSTTHDPVAGTVSFVTNTESYVGLSMSNPYPNASGTVFTTLDVEIRYRRITANRGDGRLRYLSSTPGNWIDIDDAGDVANTWYVYKGTFSQDVTNLIIAKTGTASMEYEIDYIRVTQAQDVHTIDTVALPPLQIDLTMADATSTGAIDTAAVQQIHDLVAADATSTGEITTAIGQQIQVGTVENATSAGAIDAVAVAKAVNPTVTDATSTGAIDAVLGVQVVVLTPADATSTGSMDTTDKGTIVATRITVEHQALADAILVSTDATSTGAIDAVALEQFHNLVAADATSTGEITTAEGTHEDNLTVADATSTGAIDTVSHVQDQNLTVTDATSTHAVDAVAVQQDGEVFAADATSTGAIDAVEITQDRLMVLADIEGAAEIDPAAVQQVHDLVAADATSTGAIDTFVAEHIQIGTLENLNGVGEIDPVALQQIQNLVAADADSTGTVDPASVQQIQDLVTVDTTSTGAADTAVITQLQVLGLQDADSTGAADAVALDQLHYLTAADVTGTPAIDNNQVFIGLTLQPIDATSTPTIDTVSIGSQQSLTVEDLTSTGAITTESLLDETVLSPLGFPTVGRIFRASDLNLVVMRPALLSPVSEIDSFAVLQDQFLTAPDLLSQPEIGDVAGTSDQDLVLAELVGQPFVPQITAVVDNLTEGVSLPLESTGAIDTTTIVVVKNMWPDPLTSTGELTIPTGMTQEPNLDPEFMVSATTITSVQVTTTQDLTVADIDGVSDFPAQVVSTFYTENLDSTPTMVAVQIEQLPVIRDSARAAILISV